MNFVQYNKKAIDEELDRFIEYDCYYYSRPNAWTWLISPDYIDGFYPCPACDRGGKILSKWYMGEYMPNDEYRILDGQNPRVSTSNADFRTALRAKGYRLSDYANYNSIVMLVLVKYADLNFQYCLGYSWYTGQSRQVSSGDNILGDDGYNGATRDANASIKVMGITDFYGNVWKHCDSTFYNRYVYVNDDLDNIIEWPTMDTWQAMGYKKVGSTPNATEGYIKEFVNDSQFPWMTFPKTIGGDKTNPVGDLGLIGGGEDATCCILLGGNTWNDTYDGPFCWYAHSGLLFSEISVGCLATAFPSV